MTTQQHAYDLFIAWGIALSFITILIIIFMVWALAYNEMLDRINPFGPFIRLAENRQKHKQRLQEMKMRASLINSGTDPDYVTFMEKECDRRDEIH